MENPLKKLFLEKSSEPVEHLDDLGRLMLKLNQKRVAHMVAEDELLQKLTSLAKSGQENALVFLRKIQDGYKGDRTKSYSAFARDEALLALRAFEKAKNQKEAEQQSAENPEKQKEILEKLNQSHFDPYITSLFAESLFNDPAERVQSSALLFLRDRNTPEVMEALDKYIRNHGRLSSQAQNHLDKLRDRAAHL